MIQKIIDYLVLNKLYYMEFLLTINVIRILFVY
jgi:hypothetical protein